MKTITVALLGSMALFGFVDTAAAQTGVTRIAYDQCRADAYNWGVACSIGMVVDGSDAIVANGIAPRWSPDGSKIVFIGPTDPSAPFYPGYDWAEILVLNVGDGSVATVTTSGYNWAPVWSRDGAKIAFMSTRDGSPFELYVMDANGANPTRITNNVGFTGDFRWSPDNSRFAISSNRDGSPELYLTDADGSNLTRLTNNMGVNGQVSWSSDGSRIAFDCLIDGREDICAINADGTNFVRLTNDPASDWGAVFSPVDGRIAFVTARFGADPEIAIMEANGAVTRVAAGTGGGNPTWSPEGSRLTFVSTMPSFYTGNCYGDDYVHDGDEFCIPVYDVYLVDADGTGLGSIANGDNPDWFRSLPGQPVAAFTHQCSGVACDFDAAGSFDSDGTIASYLWQFGDGTSASGPTPHHDYAAANQYGVSLTVTDNSGTTGVVRMRVEANVAPTASFTVACDGPTCAFDGSGSSDPDGTIARYEWFFGDGNWGGTAPTANHTYRTGTYSARLIITDSGGATDTMVATVNVVNEPPVAAFTFTCNGTTCSFDASASSDPDGTISYYYWNFGDGTGGDGAIVSHTFAPGSTSTVTLVVDDLYGTGSQSQTVTIPGTNVPPVASFTSSCSELECSFNASASSDADGTVASYAFNFGDGATSTGTGWGPYHRYAADGTYTVTLTVTDNGGLTAQTTRVVTLALNKRPVASFTSTCNLLTCTFDGSGSSDPDGTIASYAWNFGDGATWGGATASRTYAAGGTYNVTLTVVDNIGAVSQIAHVVTVNAPPVASFTSACSALTCSFNASGSSDPDGAIASYAWSFGDGATGSGATANRTYAAGGSYTVTLTVTDNAAATSQTVRVVTVNVPPVASFTSSCSELECTFNASASSDPDGTIPTYTWSFGDGTTGNSDGWGAYRRYAADGTYTVTLTVTDNGGLTAQTTHLVSVALNKRPVASFTSACNGLTCTFNGSGSSDPDGTIVSYTWNFGDGAGGSGATSSHTYNAGSSYTVTLAVTDNASAMSQTVHVVTVNAAPVASFTSACSALTCSFNASGSWDPDGTIASFAWNYGDGTTGSGVTSSRAYAAGGSYTVTLTVTDNAAATSQTVRVVTVNAPPVASFTSACSALTCSFNASGSSDPDGTIASYAWSFGDGATGSGAAVNRTYAAGGSYTVTLTVTDNGGAAGTQVRNVTVAPPPAMHVGDLDRAVTNQANAWTATVTITIHDSSHRPLANAVVSSTWSDASMGSCTTNANGQCAISKAGIAKKTGSVNFSVTNVSLGSFVYKPADNHDPDGDSNGTTISVTRP